MSEKTQPNSVPNNLKCPECQALLKRRRSRSADECELVCGGCGQLFDACSAETLADLTQPGS